MNWTPDRKKPICPQLCQHLCARIVTGELLPDQRLPSVRELAMDVGVNPNTVQFAFTQLEQQGILYSQRGAGWFVCPDITPAQNAHQALIRETVDDFFQVMTALGMNPEQTKEFVKEWFP